MKIQDYLHYYINAAQYRLRYVDYKPGEWTVWSMLTPHRYFLIMNDASVEEVQLRLRPLESITEEEAEGLVTLVTPKERWEDIQILFIKKGCIHYMDGSKWYGNGVEEFNDLYVYYEQLNAAQFHYLLSKGFDLFGLIPAGLAVDATTVNQPAQPTGGGEG